MGVQVVGAGFPFAGDSAAGLAVSRNGEPVLAALRTVGGRCVVLVEEDGFAFVTAVTDPGRDGWDGARYFPYAVPPAVVDPAQRLVALGLAQADFLGRAAGYLPAGGRAAFRADLRGYVSGLFAFDGCDGCDGCAGCDGGTARACPVSGVVGCAERSCELHYLDAPVRLAGDYLDDDRGAGVAATGGRA